MVRKKFKRREITLSLGVISIIILILTFYIWHQVESVRLGYETRELEARVQSLMKEVETLEAEKSSLLSLDRVETIAKKELGLRPPIDNQIIREYNDNGHARQ
jgi:cell division protein FtsL